MARDINERRARSLYGQIRLTVTFERGGQVSYRALAKRPEDGWKEQHVFAAGAEPLGHYPPTFHDALSILSSIAESLRWLPTERGE